MEVKIILQLLNTERANRDPQPKDLKRMSECSPLWAQQNG